MYIHIYVNYNISLTWNVGLFGYDFPYTNHDSSEGEQWGRYNLPRIYIYILLFIFLIIVMLLSIYIYICICILYIYVCVWWIYTQYPINILQSSTVIINRAPHSPQPMPLVPWWNPLRRQDHTPGRCSVDHRPAGWVEHLWDMGFWWFLSFSFDGFWGV